MPETTLQLSVDCWLHMLQLTQHWFLMTTSAWLQGSNVISPGLAAPASASPAAQASALQLMQAEGLSALPTDDPYGLSTTGPAEWLADVQWPLFNGQYELS